MPEPIQSPWLVPFRGRFQVAKAKTAPDAGDIGKKAYKKLLRAEVERIEQYQRILYADNRHSLLLVFQAMDAAGKDSTIRAVMSGVNPAGFQVFSFKKPSDEELDHDYLWRTSKRLPERGRIGIFNRSYYEEVLVVRVHPEYLKYQRLPHDTPLDVLWKERYESIRDHEKHLARNGVTILKFWLNVSRDEQKRRFLRRLERPDKNWKFSEADVVERGYWDSYMEAYQDLLCATSRPWAPWYAIPADSKPFMRLEVARLVVGALENMNMGYPKIGAAKKREFEQIRKKLSNQD